MSKLLSLKQWITLDEAATHLSSTLSESVTVADLYRFCLAGHLTLSVNLVNKANVHIGKVMAIRDAGFKMMPGLNLEGSDEKIMLSITEGAIPEFKAWVDLDKSREDWLNQDDPKSKFVCLDGVQISDDRCIQFEKKVTSIEGVWDLSMLGAASLDIEHALQGETGGPAVELVSLEGVFLCKEDGRYAQVLESFAENQYASDELKSKKWNDPRGYYPAGKVPDDAPIVVRPSAISEFIRSVSETAIAERAIDERERASLLRIIRALDVMANLPTRGAATSIETQLQQLGFSKPSEATIRKLIEQARALEPDNPQ